MMRRIIKILLCLMLCACATPPVNDEIPAAGISISTPEKLLAPQELVLQADAAYRAGDWTKAGDFYSKLLENNPDEALYWYRLGNTYASSNHLDAAIIAYQQVIRIDPADTNAWFNLGMTHLKLASHSFDSVQGSGKAGEPLSGESERLLEGILKLLEQTP